MMHRCDIKQHLTHLKKTIILVNNYYNGKIYIQKVNNKDIRNYKNIHNKKYCLIFDEQNFRVIRKPTYSKKQINLILKDLENYISL